MRFNLFYFVLIIVCLGGCSPTIHQTHKTEPARLGAETPFHSELMNLPPPRDKLVAAVYKFRDQTGQYKPSDYGSSWSTAVTQGATTILIRALEESGWFTPLERENLGNLSAERQIITNTLAAYEGKGQTALSPLLFAGIILEGGIISYETNVRTGGAGLRYFGTGASGQYREDRVSIYLRAVSTKNGEILKTVYSTKSILSQKIDFSVFRYVKFKRLLEAETGVTYNEPSEMAVTEAIEKAVYSLVVEGIKEGLWMSNGNVAHIESVVNDYINEKNENLSIDHLGRQLNDSRSMVSAGIISGVTYPDLDTEDAGVGFSTGVNLNIRLSPTISFDNEFVYGQMDSKVIGDNQYISYTPSLRFDLLPKENMSPYIKVGYGMLSNELMADDLTVKNRFTYVGSAVGLDFVLSKRVKIDMSIANKFFTSDDIDGQKHGSYNDMSWEGRIGLSYQFGSGWFNKTLIKRK
ncbi:CsgG/HfaB family protein [Carboxylicivirga marina]|uniref:Curli production assembly/transport component CsgG n=1 Tax=Carboxylicivirga marina TaxID=2800988 RepID=A0ABS1HLL5_9BACT|nr:CsgG/HfaB family protein [Carboxylicivirga marina]MBK3518355.1 hypothetical protein [Carboxylicivirga marina]